jgi:DNA invertase Pin-like site-specific DNA recombinase
MPMTDRTRRIRLLADRLRWLQQNKPGLVTTVQEYEALMPDIIAMLDAAATLAEQSKEDRG